MSLRDQPIQDEPPEIDLTSSPSDSDRVVPPGKLELVPNWTVSRVLELIQQYKKRPILWNCSGRGLCFRESAQTAWMSLGNEMGISPAECRRKITILVTQFNREFRKEEMFLADGHNFTSPWLPYAHLEFLKTKRMRKGWRRHNPTLLARVRPDNNKENRLKVSRDMVNHDHAFYHLPDVISRSSDEFRGKSYQDNAISGNKNQDPLNIHSGSGRNDVIEVLESTEGVKNEFVILQNCQEVTNTEEITNIGEIKNIEEDIGVDILSSFGLEGVGDDFESVDELEGLAYPREVKFIGPQQKVHYVVDVKPDLGDVKPELSVLKREVGDMKRELGDVECDLVDVKRELVYKGPELVDRDEQGAMKLDYMKLEQGYTKSKLDDEGSELGVMELVLDDEGPELGAKGPELSTEGPELGADGTELDDVEFVLGDEGPELADEGSNLADSCEVFGAYVAAKLRHLASDSARDKVECILSNLLCEASAGAFEFTGI